MSLLTRARICLVSAAIATAVLAPQASAQEITESHMKAARAAVLAINATGEFDAILPSSALALKEQLIQQNPNLQELIENTVNEKAIAMSARRADLEKESATAYAKVFSEEDLNAIATFYSSPAGKKLLADGPIVTREVLKAADIWQRGIVRDLAQDVAKVLVEKGPKRPATPAATAPAPEGAAAPVQPQN